MKNEEGIDGKKKQVEHVNNQRNELSYRQTNAQMEEKRIIEIIGLTKQ
jgi:hypothetical protein